MTIYEFIEDIVDSISAVKSFQFGSFKYVQGVLSNAVKNNDYAALYPMVIMVTNDFDYDVDSDANTVKQTYPLHLVIVNLTKREYTMQQRLDNNFKTILNPIYDSLIGKLKTYYSDENGKLPHNKKDHFFYSGTDAKDQNKLAERLDAVEITGLDFYINLNDCKYNT